VSATAKDVSYRNRVGKVKRMVMDTAVKPCIGCGYCCRKAPCFYGEAGGKYGCHWLEWNGKKWRCGLLKSPDLKTEHKNLTRLLYIGAGCTSSLNSWRVKRKIPTPEWIDKCGESSDGFES
jgi:hypothetical protein